MIEILESKSELKYIKCISMDQNAERLIYSYLTFLIYTNINKNTIFADLLKILNYFSFLTKFLYLFILIAFLIKNLFKKFKYFTIA